MESIKEKNPSVPVFYRGNKIWVQVLVHMN